MGCLPRCPPASLHGGRRRGVRGVRRPGSSPPARAGRRGRTTPDTPAHVLEDLRPGRAPSRLCGRARVARRVPRRRAGAVQRQPGRAGGGSREPGAGRDRGEAPPRERRRARAPRGQVAQGWRRAGSLGGELRPRRRRRRRPRALPAPPAQGAARPRGERVRPRRLGADHRRAGAAHGAGRGRGRTRPGGAAGGGGDAMTAGVTLEGGSKRFGPLQAVRELTLDVREGEFFSLLGPSGCGKTTTLRLIAGFEEPTTGRILLGGKDVTRMPPHKRSVNTVFQSYALFPHLNVHDNVAFGLRFRNASKGERRRRVAETLALVQLEGMEKRRPSQLSGGQQQRVALARALVLEPAVLLLDEPLGALDAKLRRSLQIELKSIQEAVGITFVYVTHDQEEALTMSDRMAVMADGLVQQLGTPRDV